MDSERGSERGTTLRDYLAVARRRKWIILQAVVLVPAAALAFSLTQTELYQASAEVLLSRQNLASQLTGTQDPNLSLQADRVAATQASLARVPEVARRTLEAAGEYDASPGAFLSASSVSPKTNADILDFRVTDPDPQRAERLATAYAEEFTEYRREHDTKALELARTELDANIRELERAGERDTELYRNLVDKEQQLKTLEALQTSNLSVVRVADGAAQVQPKPVRNAVLGLALGLVLGLGLAFLWEALDTRVRNAEDIAEALGLPFLARIPAPPKKLRQEARLVMLAQPTGVHAEAFRMLRTNLDFARLDREASTILVSSAVEEEGKSTTVANLAVALARSGQHVALVDLDLRKPFLDRFFDLYGVPGVTQVALGQATLDEALAPIAIEGAERRRGSLLGPVDVLRLPGSTNGQASVERGSLRVLSAGPLPPNPGEFVASHRLEDILAQLRERVDIVLIDSPPVLRVGDALTLSTRVDGIVLVTRVNILRRHMLSELQRLLRAAPSPVLGLVVTGADEEEGYSYGYGYGDPYGYGGEKAREAARGAAR